MGEEKDKSPHSLNEAADKLFSNIDSEKSEDESVVMEEKDNTPQSANNEDKKFFNSDSDEEPLEVEEEDDNPATASDIDGESIGESDSANSVPTKKSSKERSGDNDDAKGASEHERSKGSASSPRANIQKYDEAPPKPDTGRKKTMLSHLARGMQGGSSSEDDDDF